MEHPFLAKIEYIALQESSIPLLDYEINDRIVKMQASDIFMRSAFLELSNNRY